MNPSRLWFFLSFAIAALVWIRPAQAHPMGNFSINHFARFDAGASQLKLRYILDFAEIPAAEPLAQLDANGDNVFSAAEKTAYLNDAAPKFLGGLTLKIDGEKVALNAQKTDLTVIPGAGGLPTLLVKIDAVAPLPQQSSARISYEDSNFAGRTGWKEIIAFADKTRSIANSDAGTSDQSRELTIFPIDAGVVPPRQESAQFSVVMAGAGAAPNATHAQSSTDSVPVATGAANSNTPQNRFTQSIAETRLTPTIIGWGLLFAFAFGAVHALSPGHGKTMVAAYLVGSRGTPRHAMLLGIVVTITHTFGVFALGFALLFASRYVLPEKLFPALSALSGLLIFGVGLWLFMSRWQGLQARHGHSHADEHSHAHDGHTHSHDEHSHTHDEHSHAHDGEHSHTHDEHDGHTHSHDDEAHTHDGHVHSHGEHSHSHDEHSHAHDEHSHSHDDEHTHEHGVHVHSHGGKAHSHAVPDGPINMKTLVALGISGGIVPCPEALVVLLAAIKLHRIGYGLILIVAFSLGLAAALIAIGMLVVSARQRLTRFNALGEDSAIVRYLPLGSAAIITLIGAALTLQATLGKF